MFEIPASGFASFRILARADEQQRVGLNPAIFDQPTLMLLVLVLVVLP
jgi:hypothetical protein